MDDDATQSELVTESWIGVERMICVCMIVLTFVGRVCFQDVEVLLVD